MADDRITAAASLFAQAWLDGTTIDAFPNDLAPRNLAEAMAMQDAMAAQIGEDIVGWKIGEIHILAVVQNRVIYKNLIYSYKLDHPDSVASHCNDLGNTNGTSAFPV